MVGLSLAPSVSGATALLSCQPSTLHPTQSFPKETLPLWSGGLVSWAQGLITRLYGDLVSDNGDFSMGSHPGNASHLRAVL